MAEPHPAQDNHDAAVAAPPKKGGGLVKITALLFVVAIIFAECLIAYLYLPASGASAASSEPAAEEAHPDAAEEDPKADHGKAAHGKAEHGKAEGSKKEAAKGHGAKESAKGGHGEAKKEKEPAKGEHGKKGEAEGHAAPAVESEFAEVDLERFAVTAHNPASSTTSRIEFHLYGMVASKDQEEFEGLWKANQHRFRDQVLVTVRSAEAKDLADPRLGLLKRQILEKTNALLGKPLLQGLMVSDFSYLEQ